MDEKVRLVIEYERDERTMTDLYSTFGISRECGYGWLRRYRQSGVVGLVEVNRAAHCHPNQTPVSLEEALLGLRQAHMTWGPCNHPSDEDLWPGTAQAEADSGAGPAGSRGTHEVARAGDQHDGRDRKACRAGGRAPEASPDRALHGATGARGGVEQGVVRRLQGLVQERRRDAHRSADDYRCVQPLSAALAGGGEDGYGAGAVDLRGGVPRVWAPLGDAHG